MSKTIEEVKQAKRELESAISKLVIDFANENNVSISEINIVQQVLDMGAKQIIQVKAGIKL